MRFMHSDIKTQSIMVENGHVSGAVDWEQTGWHPEYWEYVKSMYGCLCCGVAEFLEPYDHMRLIEIGIGLCLN